jgi:hypothetical protein
MILKIPQRRWTTAELQERGRIDFQLINIITSSSSDTRAEENQKMCRRGF